MASPRPAEPVDIFVSYAREDRACAARLADALAACGWRVWWDREIDVGADFAALIESNLEGAQAVIVLWSAQSVRSAFVKDEAGRAREASKLQPVRIEDVELPLGFGQIQTFDLIDCDTSGPEFDSLVEQLGRALAKGAPAPVAPRRPRRLSRLLRRPAVWVGVAAVAALAIIAVLGRGYSREKRCTEAFVHTDTGVQRLQDGSTEQAIIQLTRAIDLCNSSALAYRYRGEAYARLNDYDLASADLRRALALGLEPHASKRATQLLATIRDRSAEGRRGGRDHRRHPRARRRVGRPGEPLPLGRGRRRAPVRRWDAETRPGRRRRRHAATDAAAIAARRGNERRGCEHVRCRQGCTHRSDDLAAG